MKKIVIYLSSEERIVVRKGGCQFETNLGPGFGWIVNIVNHAVCYRNWEYTIKEAQLVLSNLAERGTNALR